MLGNSPFLQILELVPEYSVRFHKCLHLPWPSCVKIAKKSNFSLCWVAVFTYIVTKRKKELRTWLIIYFSSFLSSQLDSGLRDLQWLLLIIMLSWEISDKNYRATVILSPLQTWVFVCLLVLFTLVPFFVCACMAMAPHSSTLAWKIPWTEEPGRLQPMGLQRVRHDWTTSLSFFTFMHWRRKLQPIPVFLLGESQGWGRTESDTTEMT